MICVNELTDLRCNKRAILEPLTVVLSPFAPHIAEEMWHRLGNNDSVVKAAYPEFRAEYLVESNVNYPVSFNGKVRFTLTLPAETDGKAIEAAVLADEQTARYLEGKPVKKVIVVPNKIVNIVC
jgi:leucyl-tRNA synthetase